MFKLKFSSPSALFLAVFLVSPLLLRADSGANHQVRNTHFGVSGGNVNDISKAYCCSGTLGSLVTDGTTQYILSNNHILARQDKATVGENISQPGLIDNGCRPATTVAHFTAAPQLGSNVDAAIAQLVSGKMDLTGFIEDIGVISSTTVTPAVGMAVVKSGRTTGFTAGKIGAVNVSVNVQYQTGCGQGKKFIISYTNQVVINSTTFSAGGDSGSLIVTSGSFKPVALLFAGSSSTTIGNPIRQVLKKVGTTLGRSVSFVGSGVTSAELSSGTTAQALPISPEVEEKASRVLEQNRHDLMSRPAVLAVGLTVAQNQTDGAIVVYVDKTASARPQLPEQIGGVRVQVYLTDPIIAF